MVFPSLLGASRLESPFINAPQQKKHKEKIMKKMSVRVKNMSVMFSLVTFLCVCAPGLAFGLTWESLDPMPTARDYLSVVAADGLLYGIGGNNGIFVTSAVEAYDPVTNSWTFKTPINIEVSGAAAGVINNNIYVVGGIYVPYSLRIYDIANDVWNQGLPAPVAPFTNYAGVVDGIMYVQLSDSTSFYAYDAANNTWEQKADAPEVHNGAGAGVIDGKLYVAGGNSNHLDAYDPATNTWTSKASMSTYRNAMAAGVWNGHLYVAGGADSSGKPLSSVEVYDPITDTWAYDSDMLTARYGLGGAFIDGNFYALGGNDGSVYFNILEAGAVPLPGAVWLLGTGLMGRGALGWRGKRG